MKGKIMAMYLYILLGLIAVALSIGILAQQDADPFCEFDAEEANEDQFIA
jgi:hypothetical protein